MARILVIDDTKNIRKMVGLALTQAGHEVELAEDGKQGLAMFGDGAAWDLIIVDQQMPQVEGRELVRQTLGRNPMARFIMMTAFATTELASEVLLAGALDFLRKPFSTDVLRGAVEAALAHPRQEMATDAAEAIDLPEPGQSGFSMPRLSWRLNGFSFWPVPVSQQPAPSPGMEFGSHFQVRGPNGAFSHCFVGITPHVREQVQREAGRDLTDNDAVWEKLCGEAVKHYIWEKAATPPAVLPLYDVATDSRSPTWWGPFTRG